jgi:hypothetical protein
MGRKHTSRSRGFGVGEEYDAGLALLYKLCESRLGAIVGLELAAKGGEVDCLASLCDAAALSSRGFTVRRTDNSVLDSLLCLGLLALSRGLLLRRPHRSWRCLLALAEFGGHGESVVAKLKLGRVSVAKIFRREYTQYRDVDVRMELRDGSKKLDVGRRLPEPILFLVTCGATAQRE